MYLNRVTLTQLQIKESCICNMT